LIIRVDAETAPEDLQESAGSRVGFHEAADARELWRKLPRAPAWQESVDQSLGEVGARKRPLVATQSDPRGKAATISLELLLTTPC
jgi:hypothetical protein